MDVKIVSAVVRRWGHSHICPAVTKQLGTPFFEPVAVIHEMSIELDLGGSDEAIAPLSRDATALIHLLMTQWKGVS
jgi:hypothetical protein